MLIRSLKVAAAYIVVALFIVFFLFPIFWIVLTSFKNSVDAAAIPPIWRFVPVMKNYISLFASNNDSGATYSMTLVNSLVISLISTIIAIVFGTLTAYYLARKNFKGNSFIGSWILSTLMFPPAVSLIPIFLLVGQLNLEDTRIALIIPYAALNLPLIVWMLRGFIVEIPIEIDEAAAVDGCSTFTIFWRIILPISIPGIVAAAILSFIQSWNEFLLASVLTRNHAVTAPVGISQFITMYGVQWGPMTADATIIVLPVILFTIFVRRYLVRGLTFGAVKG